MMDHRDTRAAVLASFATQIDWCDRLGSPLTAAVLRALAEDIAAGGIAAGLTEAWPGDPAADALPLRMAGALHALVLSRAAPDLVACYPPHPVPQPEPLVRALAGVLGGHRAFIADFMGSPPQTNEVGRSAVLLGGFLRIAADTGLPLRLLEIGASAGLNTRWDAFHYRLGDRSWGEASSPVRLAPDWDGPLPRLDAPVRVAERRACDVAPIDPADAVARLRLRAYVWADQGERLQRLDGAVALALADPRAVERADAAAWVGERLREAADGSVTVLYHSIMWQYLPGGTQADIVGCLRAAGARATAAAPLAWLRFEPLPGDARPMLRLTVWPGERETLLAEAQAHGSHVTWRDG